MAPQPSLILFWMWDDHACIKCSSISHWFCLHCLDIVLLTNPFSVGVLISVSSIRLHCLYSERGVCDDSRGELPSLSDGAQALLARRECKDNKTWQTEGGLIFWWSEYQVSLSCHSMLAEYDRSHWISFWLFSEMPSPSLIAEAVVSHPRLAFLSFCQPWVTSAAAAHFSKDIISINCKHLLIDLHILNLMISKFK
jgi:hypothetical protein